MSRNAFGVDHFQPVHFQKIPQTCERVVAKMFVINRVVLERFEERTKIMGLGDENTIVAQEGENSSHDVVDIFDVRKDVRSRDDFGLAFFLDYVLGYLLREKKIRPRYSALDCKLSGVRRLEAKISQSV